jgi:hypothetical protein
MHPDLSRGLELHADVLGRRMLARLRRSANMQRNLQRRRLRRLITPGVRV